MDRDPFGHRKYHGLYFILGFLIAFVAFMMLTGCEQGKTTSGTNCIGMAGMTWEGDQCEPEIIVDVDVIIKDRPPCTGWGCERPTDPPGCWYPYNEFYCDLDRPRNCCMALTPSCEACQEGISVSEWMVKTCGTNACDVEYAYWDEIKNEPVWLCQAVIIN